MAGCRVKQWDLGLGVIVDHTQGTFDLLVLKVISGTFGTITSQKGLQLVLVSDYEGEWHFRNFNMVVNGEA